MLLSGCVMCLIRSPGTPVRDLHRTTRVLRSLARCRTELLSVHTTYHALRSSGFFCLNARKFSSFAQHRWNKYNAVYAQCTLSDIDVKSQSYLSYRSVFELGCRQRSDLLLNSDTRFRHNLINISDQVRIQLRLYNTKQPQTVSATDREKKIDADKQTIADLVNISILTCKIIFKYILIIKSNVLC